MKEGEKGREREREREKWRDRQEIDAKRRLKRLIWEDNGGLLCSRMQTHLYIRTL